jgi:hypothetical protein
MSRTLYEKTLSNLQEVKAREGIVVAVACEPDVEEVSKVAEYVIPIGVTNELLLPILEVVPLQMLAYHIAVRRGCDVDSATQSGQERHRRVSGGGGVPSITLCTWPTRGKGLYPFTRDGREMGGFEPAFRADCSPSSCNTPRRHWSFRKTPIPT